MSTQISIKLIDLAAQAKSGKLQDIVARDTEIQRLIRLLMRPVRPHISLVGEPGTGKTSLLGGLALARARGRYGMLPSNIYRLDTTQIGGLLANGDNMRSCTNAIREAIGSLDPAIIIVEDIQILAGDDAVRLELTMALLQAITQNQEAKLIVTTTPSAYQQSFQSDYMFARLFSALELEEPDVTTASLMVETAAEPLARYHHLTITTEAISSSIHYGSRFKHGRALPDTALRILEEACVQASLNTNERLTDRDIKAVVAEQERLPLADLDATKSANIRSLEVNLQQSVLGQQAAIHTIASTIIRSQLGLGDESKPRGSFLMLGPSGVGKTETAKSLARLVYHNPKALIRLDMSEFAESHAAVRLIGSPPGYVGYEEGGQLTGAVSREPFSLVLLDEIEKAHPKVFDLFLQLLDDGRLTDSSGQTVDFTSTTIMATSNVGSREITEAAAAGINVNDPEYARTTLMPLLMNHYRPEFLNRFDAIVAFQPLAREHLVQLAQRELAKLSGKLAKLDITFTVADDTLAAYLEPLYNPQFGARPVKRMISHHFETPIAEAIVSGTLPSPSVITGAETWLTQGVTR